MKNEGLRMNFGRIIQFVKHYIVYKIEPQTVTLYERLSSVNSDKSHKVEE